jgi:GNAT superfamily N-acetyltransferase
MGGPGAGPAVSIRRLGPGDESVLALLAREDGDFDLEVRGNPRTSLSGGDAARFLSDPAILFWTAWSGDEVVGFLFCHVLPMRKEPAREILLYEIGVRTAWRRIGVGRALVGEMVHWMRTHAVVTAWVLADNPDAIQFYAACGFGPGTGPATYMEMILPT